MARYFWFMYNLDSLLYQYHSSLRCDIRLPRGVEVMNPYLDQSVDQCVRQFFEKFYSDSHQRSIVMGINPGRFGAGITGIAFTDPSALRDNCGIANNFPERREISAQFVYRVIGEMGGAERFFSQFFVTAVCPLGFTRDNINFNFYDDPIVLTRLKPFIVQHFDFFAKNNFCRRKLVLFGQGLLTKFVTGFNREYKFFDEIVSLEHPRYVMQYKRRQIDYYIDKYVETLKNLND